MIIGRPFVKRFALCYRTSYLPPKKRATAAPTFRPMYSDQTAVCIKMTHSTEVYLSPGYIVLDGDPVSETGKAAPHFSAHFCCNQTAGWIKMPLGIEVGLSPWPHCVRWGPRPYR